jgi:hypothetical protein
LSGWADAAFTIQAYLVICSAVRTIRIAGTSYWATALIHRTIAVIVFAITAYLLYWFHLLHTWTPYCAVYADLLAFFTFSHSGGSQWPFVTLSLFARFTLTTIVYHTIAIVI